MPERTAAKEVLGDLAPKLVELTDDVLFGDVWERPGLSKRDRSLVTVAALMALYRTDQIASHVRRAVQNGVTRDELVEAITHLAFYIGWPAAMTGILTAKKVFEEADGATPAGG
jgi:4-carboxymuconolactone decarboxylase